MQRFKHIDNVLTGVCLMLIALAAHYLAWPLASWSSVGLGPGYIPKLFAFLLLGFGGVIAVLGMVRPGPAPERWHYRPLALILAALAFFGLTLERFGMAVALLGLVLIACVAHPDNKWHESAGAAVGAVLFSWLIFIKGLGLPIAYWPAWM